MTISSVVGDNGVLTQAQKASIETNIASEKEAIEFNMVDIAGDLIAGKEIPEEKYMGEELSEMKSVVEGDWKSVIVGDKTYEDGWYLLKKEDNIPNYGNAKSNWLINYNTGEIIGLEDGNYRIANANTSGALVDSTLKLNIDPSNLQDISKWESNGIKVSFIGKNKEDENSGVKETEIKFDGVDDYLKIEGVDVNKSDGITFEFYGKNYEASIYPLEKNYFEDNGTLTLKISSFRIRLDPFKNMIGCNFGTGDSKSDLKDQSISDGVHWFYFKDLILNDEYNYFSITIDFKTNKVTLYNLGNKVKSTKCDKNYLDSGNIFNNSIPFTVGLHVGGSTAVSSYNKFDLYACRLYTRVLSDKEIAQNYIATTNYHNELVKSN